MIRLFVKLILIALFIVCSTVIFIMYIKLSFVDWPYLYVGLISLILALLIKRKHKSETMK